VGFNSATLDAQAQMLYLKRNKMKLAFAAIGSILRYPHILPKLYQRYRSITVQNSNKSEYVVASGARGEYWAWVPNIKDPETSINMHKVTHQICALLGSSRMCIEVDTSNKKILAFHKLNGAKEIKRIKLPDGRTRVIMEYQY
ncbi:MAG: hypothetical protein LBM06_04150, partial [Prevotellaceae bacterium]|nr:hypothetical protein [Prevotellaceae bacterium]